MAVRQGLGGRREKLIVIAVDLAVAVDQQPSGTVRRRPVDEEAQGTEKARMRRGVSHLSLFSLDFLEIGNSKSKFLN